MAGPSEHHARERGYRRRWTGRQQLRVWTNSRHVPTPLLNTEFNSVLKYHYGLKMRLSRKLAPIYFSLRGFSGLGCDIRRVTLLTWVAVD